MPRVAVIGVGRMGGPIADHLVAAGHEVRVYDVDPQAVHARVARGAIAAASPSDAARAADFVSIVVFDDAQVLDVVAGPDGVMGTLAPGAIVAVHTTATLATVDALARLGAQSGVAVIDAGVSGGEDGARAGTLVTMVGGEPVTVARARPVLLAFSKEVLYAGPLGAGMALKLLRNATFYAVMTAIHEAMRIGRLADLDLQLIEHTLAVTGALTQATATFALGGPEPLADDAPEQQRTAMEHLDRLARKDLDALCALSTAIGADMPVFEATRAEFRRVARL